MTIAQKIRYKIFSSQKYPFTQAAEECHDSDTQLMSDIRRYILAFTKSIVRG